MTAKALTFAFVSNADDDSVDAQHDLLNEGAATGIYIQDGRSYGGGYSVDESGSEGTDGSFWVRSISTHKTLIAAKEAAITYFHKSNN